MVPYITDRGNSFRGAGLYYLQDKGEQTNERVAWTHTVNLPTEDPQKAINWMAFTASHAGMIKQQAGIKNTGRKSRSGMVYAYSLSWSPEQQPTQEDMLTSALETLQILKLQDHQALFVAHNDTEHPHVHIICNLVSPADGRIKAPSYDRLTLSAWAEGKENDDGKIYCEQRVENNRRRREQALQNRELALIKHREEKLKTAEKINSLYRSSDSGKAFQAALEEQGFTLAKGDRRGFTIVDAYGKIHSLSRQLSGQRAKDIKERLSDIDPERLPEAKAVSQERMYYDRDKAEIESQKAIVDAAITQDEEKRKQEGKKQYQKKNQKQDQSGLKEKEADKDNQSKKGYDKDAYLRELDAQRQFETRMQQMRDRLEKQIAQSYARHSLMERITDTQNKIEKSKGLFGSLTGKRKQLEEQLEGLQKTLVNMDMRIQEQRDNLEAEIKRQTAEAFPQKQEKQQEKPSPEQRPPITAEQDKAAQREELRHKLREEMQRRRENGKDRNKDRDYGL